jgi:hypothetical protein
LVVNDGPKEVVPYHVMLAVLTPSGAGRDSWWISVIPLGREARASRVGLLGSAAVVGVDADAVVAGD